MSLKGGIVVSSSIVSNREVSYIIDEALDHHENSNNEGSSSGFMKSLNDFRDNKWTKLVVFAVTCLTTSCVYYGWQQYSEMLYKSGAYAWECPADWSYDNDGPCTEQEKSVGTLYSIGCGFEYSLAVVAGVLLDHLGPRYTGLIGECLFCCGVLLLMFSSQSFQAYIPALMLTGGCVNVTAFPSLILGELFPKYAALAVSVVLAAQTGCTIVTPILLAVWNSLPEVTFKEMWGCYLAVIWLPITVMYVWVLPTKQEFLEKRKLAKRELIRENKQEAHVEEGVYLAVTTSSSEIQRHKDNEFDGSTRFTGDAPSGADVRELLTPPSSTSSGVVFAQSSISEGGERAGFITSYSLVSEEKTATWGEFFRNITTIDMIVAGCYVMLLMWLYAYYPTVVRDAVGEDISTFVGWAMPSEALFALVFGWCIDLWGTIVFMYVLAVCLGLSYGLTLIDNTVLKYICAVVFIAAQSTIFTPKYTFVQEMFDPHHYGKLVGTLGFLGGMATLMNIPVGHSTNYPMWFHLDAGLSIVLVLLCSFLLYRQVFKMVNYRTLPMKKPPAPLKKVNAKLVLEMNQRMVTCH